MKKVYQITKFVVASSIKEAIRVEKDYKVEDCYITNHSRDILLESLHRVNKI